VYKACGVEGIVVAHAANQRAEDMGKTLAEIDEERGCDPFVAAMDLLGETGLERVMNSIGNALGMRETDIAREPRRPWNPHFYAVFAQVHNTL
jgi:N-acyl-D-aspartate/D-glutamate deacylase